jgi:hypothetical protein
LLGVGVLLDDFGDLGFRFRHSMRFIDFIIYSYNIMSSIADLRAFLQAHKLPKMTAKKSVLMEACIERGWKPSGSVNKKMVESSDSDSDSVQSAPPKKQSKKLETRIEPKKVSKKADEPVFKGSRTVPAGRPKVDIQKPTISKSQAKRIE